MIDIRRIYQIRRIFVSDYNNFGLLSAKTVKY